VPLTRGLEATIDAADVGLVEGFNWYALVTQYGHAYAMRAQVIDGHRTSILMHRLIVEASTEDEVDHIDGDGLNNRRSNLRTCTPRQNSANQRVMRRNKLGFKGVAKKCRRFYASIQSAGKTVHLGTYDTPEEAAAAYRGAAKALHGDFAWDG